MKKMSSEGDVGGDVATRDREERDSSGERISSDVYGRESQLMVHMLPEKVKKRLRALKTLQAKTAELEAKFFQEVHAMECRYSREYKALNNKRNEIVVGAYEPSEEELYPEDPVPEITGELAEKLSSEIKADGPGIPDFWLTIFKNVAMLNEMVQPHDEPILKHLHDVKVDLVENPMSFKLEFYFTPNEFFSNKVLTKEYELKCKPEEDDPFSFEGPEIYKCRGCQIDWYNGKDVTVKTVKKRQKHHSRAAVRTISKQVQAESFFNFFNPPQIPDDPNAEMEEEAQALISADFELGHYIRERIVPHAVLYFTGEALEDEDYESTDSEESSSRSTSSESSSSVSPARDSEGEKE
ncbi:nucleosome assembly protein 1-like 1-A [Cimex lectularius]|uniref:Uncharacterized protein n=1 Tax=Cimex lectularius TaxID=79782 RepID=A0A8I6SD33_CIMLE|nr:nucleosome assembly protein 1-like 1-A [Cimex lectularius]XP_014262150.1 nucleosome assembly protein 1-like 1-A [Cimex lectularius]